MALDLSPQQFWRFALTYEGDECLLWPFATCTAGYGMARVHGKYLLVHRVVCAEVHGAPPTPKHEAAHDCGNRRCIAPRHLSWKSNSENELDKRRHGTDIGGMRHPMRKLTEQDVRAIRAAAGTASQSELGRRFGVSQTTIGEIINRRSWVNAA